MGASFISRLGILNPGPRVTQPELPVTIALYCSGLPDKAASTHQARRACTGGTPALMQCHPIMPCMDVPIAGLNVSALEY
jgi:hypothetical protein